MTTKVQLIVNGLAYGSWESIGVTRTIEGLAGSFSLTVSDAGEIAIREEDRCQVLVGDETAIDGHVETRAIRVAARERSITYSGFDGAQALVANSVLLDRWTFRDLDVLEFARTLAAPHGIKVFLAKGLVLPKSSKVVVNPGDSAFDALSQEATKAGVLLVSDGAGGVLITQGGTARAEAIVEGGARLISGSVSYNGSERYYRYVVLASRPGSDESSGDATRTKAEAIDKGVRRTDRVLVIRPSTPMTNRTARAHADWQARTRAAQAEAISITVHGWQQTSGQLWPVNHLTRLQAPSMGIDGDLLIAEASNTLDNGGGQITRLRLVRPDAYTPDPAAIVKAARWKK